MSDIQIGDRVKIVKVAPGDEAALDATGTIVGYSVLTDYEMELDSTVVIDDDTFETVYVFEDEVELI